MRITWKLALVSAFSFSFFLEAMPLDDCEYVGPCVKRVERITKQDELPPRDRLLVASSLVSCLQTVRSQVSLYGNQHNAKHPNFHRYGWRQMTQKTDRDGMFPDVGEVVYGPYLQRDAFNLLNNSSAICTLDWIDPEAGWAYDLNTGQLFAVVSDMDAEKFDLDTVNDVRTYDAFEAELIRATLADLRVLRNAIDLYATEHGGAYPDAEDIAQQITRETDAAGHAPPCLNRPRFNYGLYLRSVPSHPANGSDVICAIDVASVDAGWAYNESTGNIFVIADLSTDAGQILARTMPDDVVACQPEASEEPAEM